MTETTNTTVTKTVPTLFYDGTCGMCTAWARRLQPFLIRKNIEVKPFADGAAQPEMILRLNADQTFGGADAAIQLLKAFPITFLLGWLLSLSPFKQLAHESYRYIAKNRHCNCTNEKRKQQKGWFVLAGLLVLAFLVGFVFKLEGWVWMWLLAAANWFGFKWMCFIKAGSWSKIDLTYFLWPGMDTAGFRYSNRSDTQTIGWLKPAVFINIGLTLIYLTSVLGNNYTRGLLGFTAMLCLLHFGSFDVLAALLNRLGFAAEPIMRRPWLAKGLGDFWSNRWNRAFSDWTRSFLFYPLTRKLGVAYGTMTGFFASGIAHEIAISVPARAGYGLPTLYFLIQGAGLLIAKRFNFRKHRVDRIWMWLIVLLPAPLLLHRPFFDNVFNPMTQLITQLFN